ncbi:AAA family ATPase [Isoptericola sediminis]|uniref:AAA family ATPase n=1 Tax=Isoptericola sediminis TaxID=2733572 RepID=A0A849JVB7_9MICO|nr:AAA family ATPase [Isoptericola sediminis]NNU27252.1 AAA family ATPase [Isoptericola sediminis]
MSDVLIATDSRALLDRVHAAADGACVGVHASPLPTDPAVFLGQVRRTDLPEVVVLDATHARDQALALAGSFDRLFPGVGLVLVSAPDESVMIEALRAGVRDVVPPHVTVDEMRDVLARVADTARVRRAPGSSGAQPSGTASWDPVLDASSPRRVISVLSPKGGVGKTTVATNLAVGLASAQPGSTVLVDLDLQFGDVATALGLEPESTLGDIVTHGGHQDPIALKTRLAQHPSGLLVAGAPNDPASADVVTPEHVGELLDQLTDLFQHVVIDTAAGLGAHTLAAADHTTDPLLVTSMDVPGVRGLRKELDALTELGMLTESRRIMLNFADPRAGLSLADVEATLGVRVDLTMPHSRAAVVSMNMGEPLTTRQPRDPAAKVLRRLQTLYQPASASSGRTRPRIGVKVRS